MRLKRDLATSVKSEVRRLNMLSGRAPGHVVRQDLTGVAPNQRVELSE